MKTRLLGAAALSLLTLVGTLPVAGCNGTTVAQDIVNWTPAIVSAAQTIDASVAVLDPANAAPILLAGTTFTAAAELVQAQAKTYLANPTATALQQLQAQALAFQGNVNTALLQAAKITNQTSQQQITIGINAAVTGISAILALITTIKGSSITPATVVNTRVSQVLPLINRKNAVAEIAAHYGEPSFLASMQFDRGVAQLQAAGL